MNIYLLSNTQVTGTLSLPVIQQRFFKPSIDFLRYDYLIFTSKNGVLAAEKIDPKWKEIPALAIGRATAQMVEKLGGTLAFVAKDYYGEEFAKEIIQNFEPDQCFLYLRAKKVLSPLEEIVREAGFFIESVVVYETLCIECDQLKKPPKGSVIIFSSPSTIECFLRCYGWDESYKAVAIGKKTAASFPYDIHIAPEPDLNVAVEFARRL